MYELVFIGLIGAAVCVLIALVYKNDDNYVINEVIKILMVMSALLFLLNSVFVGAALITYDNSGMTSTQLADVVLSIAWPIWILFFLLMVLLIVGSFYNYKQLMGGK